jgi:hypothetical protein
MIKYAVMILIAVLLLAVACNKNFINIKRDRLDIKIISDTVSYTFRDTMMINLEIYYKSSDISKCPISSKMLSLVPILNAKYLAYPMSKMYFENITKDSLIMLNAFAKDTIQACFTSDSVIPKGHYDYKIYLHAEAALGDSVYRYSVPSTNSIAIDVN